MIDSIENLLLKQNSLEEFVGNIDLIYTRKLKKIALFDTQKTKLLSPDQKKIFCKVFYHIRGHFHDFLWIMGNFLPNEELKQIVLSNIAEEFGVRCSHEQLYVRFAEALGIDMIEEIKEETHNLEFAKAFNRGHKEWLLNHDWEYKMCAFSAYERLDNVDYPHLLDFAKTFGLSDYDLSFFRVHTVVRHFESTEGQISKIWEKNKEKVIPAFYFIYNHQLLMWSALSDVIFNYQCESQQIATA
jgi:pyrroloquinoline quinone (PQQ) biosynthesis protein C